MARNWGYPNGQIPAGAMLLVRGEYFQPDAGAHLLQLESEFERVFGHQFLLTQGYRPLGSTSDTNSNTQWGAWYIYQTQGRPIAARPGTSNHGDGCAVDVGGAGGTFNTAEHNWLVANAPRFGWAWGSTPSEPWHFDYTGPITITAGSGGAILIPNIPTYQEDDMPNIWGDTAGTLWFGPIAIGAIQHHDVLLRYLKSTPDKRDTFNGTQAAWITSYLGRANAAGISIPAATMPTFDITKLASAVADALATKNVKVDAASLTAPLDAAFSRSLAAIAKASATATAATVNWDPVKLADSIAQSVGDRLVQNGVIATVDGAQIQDAVSQAIARATQAIAAATAPAKS